ncbi:MAG: TVP38/TMEM64 family protein [Deltaproteobacteria bacterium]|nr:MAG: TVP38/TMEM64 family protein [Deltaproteobacteria bacterium]
MNALVTPPRTIAWGRWALAGLAAAAVVAALVLLPIRDGVAALVESLRDLGAGGLALFALSYVVALVLTLPSSIMCLGAGFAWGAGGGFAIALPSLALGATLAFLVGRHVFRHRVARRVASSRKLSAIDRAVGERGGRLVFLLRLSPVIPFNYSNYVLSVTRVDLKSFVLATAAGMIPTTLLYTWLGSTLPALTGDAAATGGSDTARTVMLWATVAVTLVVTVLVGRFARRAVARATA